MKPEDSEEAGHAPNPSRRTWRPTALLLILFLATALRLTGLSWGLRHPPEFDERVFVENVRAMITAGDLDHRYYEYPGLAFYLLYPVLWLIPDNASPASFYLAARGLVVAFSLSTIVLVYFLSQRLSCASVGLTAATFLAVSPVEIHTAHMVRVDPVLAAFEIAAVFVFLSLGRRLRFDVLAGVALGAAIAIKFTGVLLIPTYLAFRLLSPGWTLRRITLTGLITIVTFVVFTPYSVLNLAAYLDGVATQVTHHYGIRGDGPSSYSEMVWTYLGHPRGSLRKALGSSGVLLAILGLFAWRKTWKTWLPLLLLPAVTVGVLSTAEFHHDRHLVPSLGVVALFAAIGVDAISKRWASAGIVVLAIALIPPLVVSAHYVRDISAPSTRDRALDWIETHQDPGSRILNAVVDFGIDGHRFELLSAGRDAERNRILAAHMDLVVLPPQHSLAEGSGLELTHTIEPGNPFMGPPIAFYRARVATHPDYLETRITPEKLRASERSELIEHLVDGRTDTYWETSGPQKAGDWIELELPRPIWLAKVELMLGQRPLRYGRNYHIFARRNDGSWERIAYVHARPPVRRQVQNENGKSQRLIFPPVLTSGLRIVQQGARTKRWSVAELRVFEVEKR